MQKRTCLALGLLGLLSCDRFLARNPEYCLSNADCAGKGPGREVCNLTLNSCGASTGPVTVSRLDPATSPPAGGVPVKVIGQGFQPGMRVLVQNTPVETEYRSATELSFVVPPGTVCTAVEIAVQAADGSVLPGRQSFRYKAKQLAFAQTPKTWAMMSRGIDTGDINGDRVSDIVYVNFNNSTMNQVDIYTSKENDYSLFGASNLQGSYERVKLLGPPAIQPNLVAWRPDGFVIVWGASGAGPVVRLTTLGGLAVAPINNGDPLSDVVVIENSMMIGQLIIYLNNSTNSFAQQPEKPSLAGAGKALVVGDFDNDGKSDIVVALDQNMAVQLFRGNGDGSFLAGVERPVPFPGSLLAAADA